MICRARWQLVMRRGSWENVTIGFFYRMEKWSFQVYVFFFQAEDGIRDGRVTGVQTCALPISRSTRPDAGPRAGGRPALSRAGPRPRGDRGRRRVLSLDRRGVGDRENRARSPDGAFGDPASLVRLGEQQGLRHAGPPRRARGVRLHVSSPQELRAGGGARAHGFAGFKPFLNSAKGRVLRISLASSPARLAR